MTAAPARIPVVINSSSGTAEAARAAVKEDARFVMHEASPPELAALVRQLVIDGAGRIVVAGGDGSVATAAGVVARSPVELAVLPGGTLNHFARALGIPTERADALELAATGIARPVNAAYVNERLFLNTSSVGAYVTFVRLRERLRPWLGYYLASFLAAARLATAMPRVHVTLEVEGKTRVYRAPLLYIGVGERTLRDPLLADLVTGGRPGLHVVVVRTTRLARLVALGLAAARGGPTLVERQEGVDAFVVDSCDVALARTVARLATDGEVITLQAPLRYEFAAEVLRVVTPGREAA